MATVSIESIVVVPAVAEVREDLVVLKMTQAEATGLRDLLYKGVNSNTLTRLGISGLSTTLARAGVGIDSTIRYRQIAEDSEVRGY